MPASVREREILISAPPFRPRHGVVCLTRSAVFEYIKRGIYVNAVSVVICCSMHFGRAPHEGAMIATDRNRSGAEISSRFR